MPPHSPAAFSNASIGNTPDGGPRVPATEPWKDLLVYGGSFDPPHRAHVTLPFAAARVAGAEGVIFIPAGRPPHKSNRVLTHKKHRLAMLSSA